MYPIKKNQETMQINFQQLTFKVSYSLGPMWMCKILQGNMERRILFFEGKYDLQKIDFYFMGSFMYT